MVSQRSSQGVTAKSRSSRARAARARRSAAAGFPTTPRIPTASAIGSSERMRTASAGDTTSGTPPTAVVTTGTPAAIASNNTTGAPSVREAGPRQPIAERSGHGDDRIEAAEGSPLQPLVRPVLPPAAREAVRRRDDRNAQPLDHARVEDIRPVPVGVNDIGAQATTQCGNGGALPPISPSRNHDCVGVHAHVRQRREKRRLRPPPRSRVPRNDVDPVAQTPESPAPHLPDAPETAELAGRHHVYDHHVPPETVASVQLVRSEGRALREAPVVVPSRMTTAAATPRAWVMRPGAVRTGRSRARAASLPGTRNCGGPPSPGTLSTGRRAASATPGPSALRPHSLA